MWLRDQQANGGTDGERALAAAPPVGARLGRGRRVNRAAAPALLAETAIKLIAISIRIIPADCFRTIPADLLMHYSTQIEKRRPLDSANLGRTAPISVDHCPVNAYFLRCAFADLLAAIEHYHPIRDVHRDAHFVLNQHDGGAELVIPV